MKSTQLISLETPLKYAESNRNLDQLRLQDELSETTKHDHVNRSLFMSDKTMPRTTTSKEDNKLQPKGFSDQYLLKFDKSGFILNQKDPNLI